MVILRPLAALSAVLAVALPGQGALAAPVSGEAAVELVRAAMTAAGVPAPTMTAPLRALPDCDHPPKVTPRGGTWTAAELTCNAPKPWVRVLRTGSAGAMTPPRGAGEATETVAPDAVLTLVAARPVPKGKRIAAEDLTTSTMAGIAPALRLDDPALAIGRRLRVALGAGQPVTERHLEPALDVEPEQMVTAILTTAGIEITTTAQALAGGTIGDQIALRSLSGGIQTEGVIIAQGIVRVRPNMPAQNAVKR